MYSDCRMPFGKHRGEALGDIPVGYLDFIVGLDDLREPFKSKLLAYLRSRADWSQLDDDDTTQLGPEKADVYDSKADEFVTETEYDRRYPKR